MMCDAPAQITFYAIPAEHVAAVLTWLNRWDLHENTAPRGQDIATVTIGVAYCDPDAGLGIGPDGGAELIDAAPGAAWRMSQEPNHGHDGQVWTHLPGWPLRTTHADQHGTEMFPAAQVREAVDTDTVDDLLGTAYSAELARLATLNGGRVLTAPP